MAGEGIRAEPDRAPGWSRTSPDVVVGLGNGLSKHSDPWPPTPEALERLSLQMAKGRGQTNARLQRPSVRLRLGPDGVAELVRAYAAGEASTSLAERFGISKQSVVTVLRAEGVAIRRQGLTTDQRARAVARYEGGSSIQQVADEISGQYETVRQALLAQGV